MTRILLCTAAALGLSAGGALAQSAVEQVTAQLAAEGYTDIEVERDANRIEVEAIKDGIRYEYAYDRISGRILEQQVRPVDEDSDDGSDDSDDDSDDLGGRPVDGDDSDKDDDENRGHGNDDDGFDEGNPGGSSDDDDEDEDEDEGRGGRDDDGDDDDSGDDDEGDDD